MMDTLAASVASRKTAVRCCEAALQQQPVKTRPGILLAARCNMFVASKVRNRVVRHEGGTQPRQGFILGSLENAALQSFELNAH